MVAGKSCNLGATRDHDDHFKKQSDKASDKDNFKCAKRLLKIINIKKNFTLKKKIQKIRMMMMINFFCGMVDRQKAFGLISSQDHCQRS